MSLRKSIVPGAVAVCVAAFAQGAINNLGTFDASAVENRNGYNHTVWLPDLIGDSVADNYWLFLDGEDALVVDETGASLNATVYQATNPNNMLDLAMSFDDFGGPGAGGLKCGGDCSDISDWDFLSFSTATLVGQGDLAGLLVDLEIMPQDINGLPTLPAQLGFGANDKDDGLGFSTWFTWEVSDLSTMLSGEAGKGDVNLSLAVSQVPLPMSAVLLLGGLAGLGALRRRKS